MANEIFPILTSLLDTDAYKLHMQQAVYHRYRDVNVCAEFNCRDGKKIGYLHKKIAQQIGLIAELSLTQTELNYLSSLPFFQSDYLQFLSNFRFNPQQVVVANQQGILNLQISGPWHEVILWEVPLLAVISEVYHEHQHPKINPQIAIKQLNRRLQKFFYLSKNVDLSNFKVIDFGTRRRFSHQIQQEILILLKQEFRYLSGTSNYFFASKLDIPPMGTQSHEWFQAHQQICPILANSQRAALQAWIEEYPNQLGIALTDCITMDAFLRDFNPKLAHAYQGLRHDSGNPFDWGEKAIRHYKKFNIDPMTKTLVFSDNLDLHKALSLYKYFSNRVNLVFGIGTRLTCDIPQVSPINIVIKLTRCNGKPVAKLSDSPGKSIYHDPYFADALRKAFDLPIAKKAS